MPLSEARLKTLPRRLHVFSPDLSPRDDRRLRWWRPLYAWLP